MVNLWLALAVLGPLAFGILAWMTPSRKIRSAVIGLAAMTTAASGILLAMEVPARITIQLPYAAQATELILLAMILTIGLKVGSWVVILLSICQLGMAGSEMAVTGLHHGEAAAVFILDPLAAVMVLIISLVGSAIVMYGIGYMDKHEHHAPATAASSGRFFFFLIGFLGLMNGLVLTDNLKWLSIFWEGTTLCSFFLISHDGNAVSRRNARLALVLNTIGGAAMSLAGVISFHVFSDESLSGLIARSSVLLPVALLVFATFTKSAQIPFQGWLLGAMVAPTPVSALLHSSTMVKAGSYLVLRLAPGFADTPLAFVVTLAGAFTFVLASALAISQDNAKKVLAYSTIANLGLIVACAAIGTPLAYSAAIVILIFHAVTKALLFLCVGTVEQNIGSRMIEDMSGLMFRMPYTTTIASIGMASMVMPPLGMLIGKWMAIESAVQSPVILMLLVIGSALTVFFWAKWIGRIITSSHHETYPIEKLPGTVSGTLLLCVLAVVALGTGMIPLYHYWIKPMAFAAFSTPDPHLAIPMPHSVDAFLAWPFMASMGVVFGAALLALLFRGSGNIRLPYLSGENVAHSATDYEFRSIADRPTQALVSSFYLPAVFGETRLTRWANGVAILIILSMFARTLMP